MVWTLEKRPMCCWQYSRFPIHSTVQYLSTLVKGVSVLLLLLVASSYLTAKNDTEGSKIRDITSVDARSTQEGIFTNKPYKYNGENYCGIDGECENVGCSYIPELFDPGEIISNFIENVFKVKCGAKITINLTLKKSKFSNNKLREKWLNTNITIARLILTDCFLTTLSDGAFSSSIFNKMTKLQLIDNNISTLKKATFHHLPKLEYLSIVNNVIKEAEKNLLQDVAINLANLELENAIIDIEVLRNITGASDLWNVKELALRHNRFTIINSELFTGVPRIESLYLQYSNIKTVCVDTFEPISGSVKQIFINDNSIDTLPKGLFNSMLPRNSFFRLSIDNNPWYCSCSLKWMQDMIKFYPQIVQNIPTCKLPKESRGKLFTDADFCDQAMTDKTSVEYTTYNITTTTTTTTITTTTTTEPSSNITCGQQCNDKVMIISIFVTSLILMCFLSAILMFVVIRRYPTMLRGNKRIVIVKRGNLDTVMVLPKGLSNDTIESANKNTIPTISQNLKEDGYTVLLPPTRNLTDKNSMSSALSVQSDDRSYISSIEPTLSELNSWRLKRSKCTCREIEPPPLPPHPHPDIAQPLSIVLDVDENESDSCTV